MWMVLWFPVICMNSRIYECGYSSSCLAGHSRRHVCALIVTNAMICQYYLYNTRRKARKHRNLRCIIRIETIELHLIVNLNYNCDCISVHGPAIHRLHQDHSHPGFPRSICIVMANILLTLYRIPRCMSIVVRVQFLFSSKQSPTVTISMHIVYSDITPMYIYRVSQNVHA